MQSEQNQSAASPTSFPDSPGNLILLSVIQGRGDTKLSLENMKSEPEPSSFSHKPVQKLLQAPSLLNPKKPLTGLGSLVVEQLSRMCKTSGSIPSPVKTNKKCLPLQPGAVHRPIWETEEELESRSTEPPA